ncbi:hypothetical protein Lal_00039790 [Lupinus albus]|nr:hypothetical protein Lal_00039790 [Lupinus albus]
MPVPHPCIQANAHVTPCISTNARVTPCIKANAHVTPCIKVSQRLCAFVDLDFSVQEWKIRGGINRNGLRHTHYQFEDARVFWTGLDYHNSVLSPWLLLGDFNEMLLSSEACSMLYFEYVVSNALSHGVGSVVYVLYKVREVTWTFNRNIFGNIFKRKRRVEARIKGVQLKLDRIDDRALMKLKA